MGLLDGLERLINEHGSAVILKERIALANDQYAALGQKFSTCEARVVQLEAENKALRLDLEQATIEIQNLKKLTENSHGQHLEDIKEKLLIALSPGQEALATQLAQDLGIGEQLATFHLEELAKTRFVSAVRFYTGRPTIWKLDQDGRGYLASHGLLK